MSQWHYVMLVPMNDGTRALTEIDTTAVLPERPLGKRPGVGGCHA
jgi:hypothetical protein